jgi:hypothetical protein
MLEPHGGIFGKALGGELLVSTKLKNAVAPSGKAWFRIPDASCCDFIASNLHRSTTSLQSAVGMSTSRKSAMRRISPPRSRMRSA